MGEFIVVGTTDELQPGDKAIVVEINHQWVAVFNLDGEYYAIRDVCTHDDGPLAEGEVTGCINPVRAGLKLCWDCAQKSKKCQVCGAQIIIA